MKLNGFLMIVLFYSALCGLPDRSRANPEDAVDWTIRINGHSQVSSVDGAAVTAKLSSILDSLAVSVEGALDGFSGFGAWTNTENSSFIFGAPTDLNARYALDHTLHLQIILRDINAYIYFISSQPTDDNLDVHVLAPTLDISGVFDPATQTVSGMALNAPGATITLNEVPLPQFLVDYFLNAMLIVTEDSLTTAITRLANNESYRTLIAALNLPDISTADIVLSAVIDHQTGGLQVELNYEAPYPGALASRDTPPVRGLMFSSANIQFTKQSLGITGGNLTHYDDVYTDEEQFFQYFDNLNIKFMRSEIPWSAIEPSFQTAPGQPTKKVPQGSSPRFDPVDDYIAAHAQVLTNLEAHYQLAKTYLSDCVVTIGDGHSAPRDAASGKKLWIGYQNSLGQEDYDLGYDGNVYVFITKETYLEALELHTRAVVRRLKNVIGFWQVENELNQADLAAVTNLRDDFRRNGSAWAHLDFLDTVMQAMATAVHNEDPSARITHNFHPFRLRKIQDWGQYLDVIGLTYNPNFIFAFPMLGFAAGDMVKIAYNLLGNTAKPVWILSSGYPAKENGGSEGWDFSENFDQNINGFTTARQSGWVNSALVNSSASQADAFLYRTYQAQDPNNSSGGTPNSYTGLIFPDGTPKASHDAIINALAIQDFNVSVNGPQILAAGETGNFSADASGGVTEIINGAAYYSLYTWDRKEVNGDWQQIASGAQAQTISQSGNDDFWLRCTVTDYYGITRVSNEFFVDVQAITGIDQPLSGIPDRMILLGNYPNPFNPSTTIQYGLNDRARVNLLIYNPLGQLVRTLVNETQSPGYKAAQWDGKNDAGEQLPSGVYIYRLSVSTSLAQPGASPTASASPGGQAVNYVEAKKMLLIK